MVRHRRIYAFLPARRRGAVSGGEYAKARCQRFYAVARLLQRARRSETLAKARAANGSVNPYKVQFWGVGNESWGCGGDFLPEEYAEEFRKFTAWLPTFGVKLNLIGSGPNGGDLGWTRRFFTKLTEKGAGQINKLYGFALHYYSGTTGSGNALEYNENEWYNLIARSDRMESLIKDHWTMMGETDREHKVKLVVDEWGAWHSQDADVPPAYLYAYAGTLRDALVSGLNLATFQRHADKVAMANPAQLINTIHSLFLAYEDKFIVTPNYHIFEMYMPHAGATAVRAEFASPQVSFSRFDSQKKETKVNLWGLNGSASVNGKTVTLTAVNPDVKNSRQPIFGNLPADFLRRISFLPIAEIFIALR